jgi:hypothetical protein
MLINNNASFVFSQPEQQLFSFSCNKAEFNIFLVDPQNQLS